jgi:hypothetical protein
VAALIEHDITTPPEERERAEEEVERVLHEWDSDLDGAISFDEFRKLLRVQHVRRAALYIEDGLSARSAHRLGARNLWMHRLYTSPRWQGFIVLMCIIHMSVALFENPEDMALDHVPRVGKVNSVVLDHPMFRYVLLGIEATCITTYFLDCYLYSGFRPRDSRSADGVAISAWTIEGQRQRDLWVTARFAIAISMAMDVVLAAIGLNIFRFSRPLRPFVLASRKRGAKEVLKNIFHTLPHQGKVFFAIFSVSALWGFVGFLLFKDVDDDSFGTVLRSVETMMIIFLSASYNQQVAENKLGVEKYRAPAAVFFVSYLVLCNMFLLRLVTAVAFDSFQKFARAERISVLSARKNALDRAFDLVASPVVDGSPREVSDVPHEQNFHMSKDSFVEIMKLADANTNNSGSARKGCLCFNWHSKTHDLQPSEKAQLLFGLADTDNDDSLSLAEFYSVCYLWRYARIVQIDRHGRHHVKLGQRWVPSGINVYFRGCSNMENQDASIWRRGVALDNTDDDKIRVMPVRPPETSSVFTPGSLQTGLMANPDELGAEALAEVDEADIRIALCDHPILACEEMLEYRVHVKSLSRRIRAFDLAMSICVLLNIVQLGHTASLQHQDDASIVAALALLFAFCFETFIKLLVWGRVKYNDRGFVIDLVTASAGVLQYMLMILRRDFDADVQFNLQEVLMILQALRVVKLLRIVAPAIYSAVHRVARHALDYAYVFTLLLYVSAVFGQELFAGKLRNIETNPKYSNWAALSHVYSFDDFGSSMLALFEVALTANWWIVMVATVQATGSAVKARAFFFIFKIVFWVLYLPIFVGFIITAFSKINSQTQDDFANGASSGVVAELPGVATDGAAGARRSADADAGPGAQQSQTNVFAPVRPRRFVVKVLTDITNKLYGIDPGMTRLRRQLQEQQSHLEALLIERDGREKMIAQMQVVLDRHGLSVDSLDGVDASVEVHLPDPGSRQRREQGGEQDDEENGHLGRQKSAAMPMPFASGPARRRTSVYTTSSSPDPRTSSEGNLASDGLQRSTSLRPSVSSFSTPTTPAGVGADMLLRQISRDPAAGRPVLDMGEELASLDDSASLRAGRYWSSLKAAHKYSPMQLQ